MRACVYVWGGSGVLLFWGFSVLRGWTGGGGGTGIEGAESGVEGAELGVEGTGSGSRGGGKRGHCGRGSGKIGGRKCFFFTRKFIKK